MRVYRLFGGKAKQARMSWTTIDPRAIANPRDALGLPNENTGEWLAIGDLRDNVGVLHRRALPLDGNEGGAPELLVPSPTVQIVISEVVRMELRDE